MTVAAPIRTNVDRATALDLYARMRLIRVFETRAGELCRKGEMPAFLHLYIGEEATAVGICGLLEPKDMLTSTHRGHGHALAKGLDRSRQSPAPAAHPARRCWRQQRRRSYRAPAGGACARSLQRPVGDHAARASVRVADPCLVGVADRRAADGYLAAI